MQSAPDLSLRGRRFLPLKTRVTGPQGIGVAAGAKALDGQAELGGHTGRVSGARHLAGLGSELALIQPMARHASSTILDYVRDAPLLSIMRTTKMKTIAAAERDASVVQSRKEGKLRRQLDEMAKRLDTLQAECKFLAGGRAEHLGEHADVVSGPVQADVDREYG